MLRAVLNTLQAALLFLCVVMAWLWFSTQNQLMSLFSWGNSIREGLDAVSQSGKIEIYFYSQWGSAIIPAWSGKGEMSLAYWWLIPALGCWPIMHFVRRRFSVNKNYKRFVQLTAASLLGLVTIGWLAAWQRLACIRGGTDS
jgi:hypothetical protein